VIVRNFQISPLPKENKVGSPIGPPYFRSCGVGEAGFSNLKGSIRRFSALIAE